MDIDAKIEALKAKQKRHRWGRDCYRKYGAHSPWARREAAEYDECSKAIAALEALRDTGEPVYVDDCGEPQLDDVSWS